jgi:hypothetical protein
MHTASTLTLIAIGLATSAAFSTPASAQDSASMCQIVGNWAGWGQNGNGSFDIASGRTCMIGASTFGHFEGSKIAKRPEHGTVKQLSVSSWQYTAKAGYSGADTFIIEGSGHDPSQPAGQRSQITLNVNVR